MASFIPSGGPCAPAASPDSVRPRGRSYPSANGESTPQPIDGFGHRGRLGKPAAPPKVEVAKAQKITEAVIEFAIRTKIAHIGRPLCASEITHLSVPKFGFLHTLLVRDRDRILTSMVERGLLTSEVRHDPIAYGQKLTRPFTYYALPAGGEH